jgi:hypothetical protein
MKLATAIVLMASLGMSSVVNADSLQTSGQVSVNRGTGFEPVEGTVPVKVGDKVLVGPGASAEIMYLGGCRESVPAGTVGSVKGGSMKDDDKACGATGHGAAGSGAGAAGAGAGIGGVAVGAAVVAGVVGGVLLINKNKSKSSASP